MNKWLVAAALALLLAACGGPPRAARRGSLSARPRTAVARATEPSCGDPSVASGARLCALAQLDAAAGVIEVHLRLSPDALPAGRSGVQLVFRTRDLGDRYAEERVEVVGGGGWPPTLGAVAEPFEITYRVALEPATGAPNERRPGTSWRRPGGWHLTGKSFLPDVVVDGVPVSVPATLVLDAGEEPLTTAAGAEQQVFDAASLTRLADEAYEVGPLTMTRRVVDGTTLHVGASGDAERAQLEATADVLARAMAALRERLGPPPIDSLLVALHPTENGGFGERLGASIVWIGDLDAPRDPLFDLSTAIHELTQLFLPGPHRIEEDWLGEGVTEYLVVTVMGALSEASTLSISHTVLRAYERYAAGAADRTIRDASPSDPRWVRDAGMVAGFCLDAHLKETGSSLGALLRTTLGRREGVIGIEALMEDLAAFSPTAASYLETLVVTRGAFAFDDCLERAGFRVRATTFEGWSQETIALDVLAAPGTRAYTEAQGFSVEEVGEGSSLEVGDVVLRVARHPVATPLDVAWALRELDVGDRFSIDLRRRGEPMTIERAVPELSDPSRTEQTYMALEPLLP